MIWSVISLKVADASGLAALLFHVKEAATAPEEFVALLSLAFTIFVIFYLAIALARDPTKGSLLAIVAIALLTIIYEMLPNSQLPQTSPSAEDPSILTAPTREQPRVGRPTLESSSSPGNGPRTITEVSSKVPKQANHPSETPPVQPAP